ncbi:hypothetical protein Y032_0028g1832 [Ancylostoma ceylanicum]|uniref:Peptidase C1A papain C-terminal domain-containing protein n=1 Tax=Ancylostoma ceylanicum TaxID=53326 RepID=A0A016UT49_9BILA|nr:hypothetical protein Y032_0028g1832 [Ancylostoma ceylanicum]
MLILFSLIAISFAAHPVKPPEQPQKMTDAELVEALRKHQTLFEVNSEPEKRADYIMDAKYATLPPDAPIKQVPLSDDDDEEIPEHFDSRERWPECRQIIETIRDQSNCGSCWAVSSAEAMSDRLCIQSGGKIKHLLSDTDILACCKSFCGQGCEGGWPIRAWEYIEKSGICTGGRYRQKGVCKPYAFHPCGYHPGQTYFGDCPKHLWPTPRCEKFCRRGYPIPYEKDKYYGLSSYTLPKDEKAIQRDLMKYGPSVATYKVFQDFRLYKRGIYEHKFGEQTGAHAVKLIGWGVENGTKYWHIANSWSPDWGEKVQTGSEARVRGSPPLGSPVGVFKYFEGASMFYRVCIIGRKKGLKAGDSDWRIWAARDAHMLKLVRHYAQLHSVFRNQERAIPNKWA